MNLSYQKVAILVIATIVVIFLVQKKMKLRTLVAYILVLSASLLSVIFDIWCSLLLNRDSTDISLNGNFTLYTQIILRLYLVSLIMLTYASFNYICRVIVVKRKDKIKQVVPSSIFAFIGSVFALVLDMDITAGEKAVYGLGPAVFATYGFSFVYIISGLILIFVKIRGINRRRITAYITWLNCWIFGSLIELFHPEVVIVSLSNALGILVMFILVENPAINIDSETNLFTHSAYNEYIRQIFYTKKNFAVIKVDVYADEDLSIDFKKRFLANYRKKMKQYRKCYLCKQSNNGWMVIVKHPNIYLNNCMDILKSTFEGDSYVKANIYVLPDSKLLASQSEISAVFDFVTKNKKEGFVYIDNDVINEYRDGLNNLNILRDAIELDLIEVYYQPIYSIKNQRFSSAEALVRIKDTNGSIYPPAKFIELAEENGMIVKLGDLIFRHICEFINENDLEKLGIEYIEVNLSVAQFSSGNLSNKIKSLLAKYKINPGRINFEITETASLFAKMNMFDNMKELINNGSTFSLDDFGTGNSNLNYIAEMPIEIVKFDYSMVHNYFINPTTRYVMDASIKMLKGLDLKIVLEGVESKEEFDIVKDLSIDYIQGFIFSKALPTGDFLSFLKENNS